MLASVSGTRKLWKQKEFCKYTETKHQLDVLCVTNGAHVEVI